MTRLAAVSSRQSVGRFPELIPLDLPRVNRVQIAGVGVSPGDVEELAQRLAHGGSFQVALKILRAQREKQDALELTAGEAVLALQVLGEPTPGLEPLRGVLLADVGWSDHSS